jgi:hypothetical protein
MAKGWMKKGHLTSEARNSMPSSDFALPGHGEGKSGKGSGSYPINDISHARNALARASGKPVEARVRAAVHRKYPSIEERADKRYGKK